MAKQTKKMAKPAKKSVAKPVPVMEHECGKECPCGCHRHSAGHRLKHIMILVIVFILGYACGKIFYPCPMRKHMQFYNNHPVFTNGCLDMQQIQNTKFQEKMMQADVNGDGCISIEEYKAFKSKWADKNGQKPKHGMFFGKKHNMYGVPKGQPQEQ